MMETDCRPLQLVTGATGALGAFILSQLLDTHFSAKFICLCRGKSNADAVQRVTESLHKRHLDVDLRRVQCFKADLAAEQLGLSSNDFEACRKATTVIHVGFLLCVLLDCKLTISMFSVLGLSTLGCH